MTYADTVLLNGKIAALDEKGTFYEALAIRHGWIIDAGKSNELSALIGPGTEVIDLKGKTVIPGLHDAHTHGISWCTTLHACPCGAPEVRTISDLQRVLKDFSAKLPKGQWLRGEGIDPEALAAASGRPLSYMDLDLVTPDNPVIIQDCYAHGAFANGLAMKIAGVTRDTEDPEGGRIDRLEDGTPTGYFHEAAGTHLIMKHVPQWSDKELRDCILEIQGILNANGYTSYTESTLGPANDQRESGRAGSRGIHIYKQLEDEGLLTCRVSIGFYTGENGRQSAERMEQQLDSFPFPSLEHPEWLQMKMCKLFCDGVHVSHTAWMLDDYPDTPGDHGRSVLGGEGASDEEQVQALKELILVATRHGYQVGVHTVGDRAIDAVIDAFINAYQEYPERQGLRHYLIHAEALCRDSQIEKAARYHLGISAQPGMGADMLEPTLSFLGEQYENAWGMARLLKAGVPVAGGNDAIYGPYPRWQDAVEFCVTRACRTSGAMIAPEERITVWDALRLFTVNAAYQEHRETITGSLEIGKAADLVILDRDIFSVTSQQIGSTQVLLTMIQGKTVFCRDGH